MKPLKDFPTIIKTPRLELKIVQANLENAKEIFNIVESCRDYLEKFQTQFRSLRCVDDVLNKLKKRRQQFIDKTGFCFFIYKDKKIIGRIRFFHIDNTQCEFGYWLDKSVNGHGFMSEAMNALEQELFKFGFETILCVVDEDNLASRKCVEHNGYVLKQKQPSEMLYGRNDMFYEKHK